MQNPMDIIKEHPTATLVIVGGLGGAFLLWYIMSRNSSGSAGTVATTTQTLTPAPTGSGSGSGYGAQNNSLLQSILQNQLSGVGGSSGQIPTSPPAISPALTGLGGIVPGYPCIGPTGLPCGIAIPTSPPTVVPTPSTSATSPNAALVRLNDAFQVFKANHVGGTSQQFAQDLAAASGQTPLTPAEALNLNYEHWLVTHPGGTSAEFSQQLRAAAAAKAA